MKQRYSKSGLSEGSMTEHKKVAGDLSCCGSANPTLQAFYYGLHYLGYLLLNDTSIINKSQAGNQDGRQ
ncbi:hypothetical protein XELAEV_18044564mg [Xenopus laevis]|uniref:Uncharacterized protein n=1 Tax=Xenopus laevis TaxID=8355 RepID=A0A974H3E4_XENLA|nr:hypothetical protein XELAEV_18044564mg [Xenopus laevis]